MLADRSLVSIELPFLIASKDKKPVCQRLLDICEAWVASDNWLCAKLIHVATISSLLFIAS